MNQPLPFTKKLRAAAGINCWLSNLPGNSIFTFQSENPTAVVPYVDGLVVDDLTLPRMFPHVMSGANARVINPTSRPMLAFVLALPGGAALWAHGSRARADFKPSSDLDLICLSECEEEFETKAGQVSVYYNCRASLMERAENGDLFARHLTLGTLPIHDPRGDFSNLRTVFRDAQNYDSILHHSADFAEFLMSDQLLPQFEQQVLEKLLWCVRTALMAEGHDIFLPGHQADDDDVVCLDALHDAKYKRTLTTQELFALVEVFFAKRPIKSLLPKAVSLDGLHAFFDETGNRVAARFIFQNRKGLAAVLNAKGAPIMGAPYS